ncbi:hypothetical protein C8R47DRAFT_1285760, partial [Mycena vitilis]
VSLDRASTSHHKKALYPRASAQQRRCPKDQQTQNRHVDTRPRRLCPPLPTPMPPLHRWPTQQSVLSWWSDSNPPRATIPLHALAKPLLKLLYHQQASAFLTHNDSSLFKERVKLLTTCVREYVSVPTKLRILRYLAVRAEFVLDARAIINEVRYHAIYALSRISEWSAATVVDANILATVKALLDTMDPYILSCTCSLLGMIERHRPGITGEACQRQLKCLFASEIDSEHALSTTYSLGSCGCEAHDDFGSIRDLELESDSDKLRPLRFRTL